jgi:type IV secretion system protein VirB5
VAIQDLRASPYKATVDFEKVFLTPQDHAELRRERYTASFVFALQEHVSNTLIPYNPLGITITYFHEDQAFQ